MEVGNEDSATETNKITYLTLWKWPSFKQEMQTAKLQYLNLFEDEPLSPEKKLAPKSCFNHSWCLHQHKQNPNHLNRDRIIILYSGQMLIMFKFVLQYYTDSTVSTVLLIFCKLCGRCWQHQTCGQVQHRCGQIRSGPWIAEIMIAEFVGRVLESQAWSMLWDMASITRHNETEVQVNSVLPSYDCTMTGVTESTGERCLTFPCLHLNRCDRKYRWKVSYQPMPALRQVWQKVQVQGVLPSHAWTSTGVTESTGE